MRKILNTTFFAVVLLLAGAVPLQAKLRVVTTLTDLKSITELIGGDKVDVFAIATGFQNPHFVDPKPSTNQFYLLSTLGIRLALNHRGKGERV